MWNNEISGEIVEEWILDLIERTFLLFKNNFKVFFAPMFIYNVIAIVFVLTILLYLFFWNIAYVFNSGFDIVNILSSPFVITTIIVSILFFILYLILYIPIFIGLLLSIKQAINKEQITTKENIVYWTKNILLTFKTYWYIFAYIALMPSLAFILWWILFNIWFYTENSLVSQIWWMIMILSAIIFIVFFIYRWIKSKFAMYSAVNDIEFTKENFNQSVGSTDWKWFKILINFFIVWLIVSLVSALISSIMDLLKYSSIDYSSITTITDLAWIAQSFSILNHGLWSFINAIINTIGSVFFIVFTYLLFLNIKNSTKTCIVDKKTKKEEY